MDAAQQSGEWETGCGCALLGSELARIRPGYPVNPAPGAKLQSTRMTILSGRPLSLLYVTARYPPFVGGTEIHTAEVARRMVARGHDVTVLTTAFEPLPTGEETVEGVRVVRVRAWPADFDFYFAPGIRSTIIAGRWDLIHCQGYHTFVAPAAMIAAVTSRQPFIVTFHMEGIPRCCVARSARSSRCCCGRCSSAPGA